MKSARTLLKCYKAILIELVTKKDSIAAAKILHNHVSRNFKKPEKQEELSPTGGVQGYVVVP